jgi:hypothetical protein
MAALGSVFRAHTIRRNALRAASGRDDSRKFSVVSDQLSVVVSAAPYLPVTNSRFPNGDDRKKSKSSEFAACRRKSEQQIP